MNKNEIKKVDKILKARSEKGSKYYQENDKDSFSIYRDSCTDSIMHYVLKDLEKIGYRFIACCYDYYLKKPYALVVRK